MPEKGKGRKVVTAKLDADVHIMLKILTKRYKARAGKGKVSISEAARFFIADHDQELAEAASRMADEQDTLAVDDFE